MDARCSGDEWGAGMRGLWESYWNQRKQLKANCLRVFARIYRERKRERGEGGWRVVVECVVGNGSGAGRWLCLKNSIKHAQNAPDCTDLQQIFKKFPGEHAPGPP